MAFSHSRNRHTAKNLICERNRTRDVWNVGVKFHCAIPLLFFLMMSIFYLQIDNRHIIITALYMFLHVDIGKFELKSMKQRSFDGPFAFHVVWIPQAQFWIFQILWI